MFMKRLAGLAGALALALATTAAFADTVTIRYSSWLPTTHWLVGGSLVPYLEEIEKVTEGRVKVEILPKVVGTAASQFDVVRDGLADMSWIVAGYTPGRFKLAEMGELPFNGDTAEISPAFHRAYTKNLAQYDEFKGVEVLAIYAASPGHVATRTRQVSVLEDFKGLKLRSASEVATKSLTLLGAVPILKSSTEAFEMLSTGAIDGSLMIPETVIGTNALDLLKYFTVIPGGFFNTVHLMIINPDKWAEISPEDQKAILAISGEKLARTVGDAYVTQNQLAFDAMKKAGYTIDEVSPDVLARIKGSLKPVETEWVEAAKAKGVADPASALAEFRADFASATKSGN
ncbi:TRAP transporter substrate-binding protein [Mesorhizobium sp. CGMCC 1.15528]|uniref:TRAP transporter substrate-binding protein n=1 Tax=Mesorhizobium zhangyense TaxID=1776730 RepID=A0A7C9VAH6_9HYPH|nr:TRAP transporter substrate-binding protein [Mesorhizobium zhangyense]NGN44604.1 TRAP transporter substrate-binding protein [Mesorhizobium zhangyense]